MSIRSFLSQLFDPVPTVHIDPEVRYNTLQGWGTSLAWWGHALGGWSEPQRNAVADLVFSPTRGLGLTVVRYNIGGGDDPSHHHMRPGGDVPGYQPGPDTWDWTADANQRWMLQAARERGANVFEAFSNSPPSWMTTSGCAAGAADGGDNLRPENEGRFAAYLATVVAHFRDAWGLTFDTVEPFNEPAASNWRTGNRQEGCHVSLDQQNRVIPMLAGELAARGLSATRISAPDDYSIDQAVASLAAYTPQSLAALEQINTHSYSGSRRADLHTAAAAAGKRLWMSEYGNGGGAHDHDAIGPALTLAAQLRRDLTDLQPAAWVYWQAVEDEGARNNWGFIHADFSGTSEQYWLTKQYFAMAQYARFIRPGYTIIAADDMRTLAAHDAASATLVVVHANETTDDGQVRIDLSRFGRVPPSAAVYRTSPGENMAQLAAFQIAGTVVALPAPPQSITTLIVSDIAP